MTVDNEVHDFTIKPFHGNNVLKDIKTYGDLLAAENRVQNPKLKAAVRRKIQSIDDIRDSEDTNAIIATKGGKRYPFAHSYKAASQSIIYAELIHLQSGDHGSRLKWIEEGMLPGCTDWDKIWESIHIGFYTENVKSTIWDQLHLNFYTTNSYNK